MLQILLNYIITIVIMAYISGIIGGIIGAFIGGTVGACKAMVSVTSFHNVVDRCCYGLFTGMKIGVFVPFLFFGLIFKMLMSIINFMAIGYGEIFD